LCFSPSKICIVFNEEEILYIGETKNLAEIWNNYLIANNIPYLKKEKKLKIAWIEYADTKLLTTLKSLLLRDLKPIINMKLATVEPSELEYLKSISDPTVVIRVPESIVVHVLEYAEEIYTNGDTPIWEAMEDLVNIIEQLEREQEVVVKELESIKANIADNTEFLNKDKAFEILYECLRSDRLEEIKFGLAKLGDLLGFRIERDRSEKWKVYQIDD
jgi:hypothetical protein